MTFFEDRARLLEMSTETEELKYRKVSHSTGEGERYEEGCLALVLLRCLRQRPRFLLSSNDGAAGKFDDLVVCWARERSPRLCALFVQLKHKTTAKHTTLRKSRLMGFSNDFSIKMYHDSYSDIRNSLDGGSYAFVLSTNIALDKDAENMFVPQDPETVPGMKLLDAGGCCYKLNPDDEDAKLAVEGDVHFMQHFYLFCSQSNYRTIKDKICAELKLMLGVDGSCCRAMCESLCSSLREWMNAHDLFLTGSWKGWLEIIDTYIKKEVTNCNGILAPIKYSSVETLQAHLQGCNPAWIRPPGDEAAVLSATKVHQIICNEKHIMVCVTRFNELEEKILCCWGPFCRWLVLVDDSEGSYDTLLRIGQLAGFERRLVIVSYKGTNSFSDTCKSGDIHDDTWKELIHTTIKLNSEQHICLLEDICDIEALKAMLDGKPRALLALSQLSGPVRMGQDLDPQPENHISRQLTSRMYVRQEFFSSLQDKEICITDEVSYKLLTNRPFLNNTVKFEELQNFLSSSAKVWPLIVVTKNVDLSAVQKICSKYSEIAVYVLTYTSSGWEILFLHRGNMKIQPFVEVNSRSLLQIVGGLSNRIIVEGKPGMGKSTMLKDMARQLKGQRASWWVVRIDLLKFSEELDSCASGVEAAEDILLRAVYNSGSLGELERSLLHQCLLSYPYVICMADGFDEVCPDYSVKCLQALQVLTPRRGKLVVTTRPYVSGHLEAGLGVLAHSLPAFSVDQVHRFHGWLGSEIEVTDVVTDLLKIPLFSSMYAELLKSGVTAHDVISLYETFFEKKFRRLYEEKWGDNLATAGKKKKFQRELTEHEKQLGFVAVTYLLPGLELPVHSQVSSIDGDDLVKAGVICEFADDKPVFIHRTFAEHFLAKWCLCNVANGLCAGVYRKAQSDNSLEFFVESLDRMASRGRPLLTAVLNGSETEVQSLLEKGAVLKERDEMGRSSLHLVAAYSRDSTLVQLLVEHLEAETECGVDEAAGSLEKGRTTEFEWLVGDSPLVETTRTQQLLEVVEPAGLSHCVEAARLVAAALAAEDGLLRWPPLRYAAERRRWKAAVALMEAGAKLPHLGDFRRDPRDTEQTARFWNRIGGLSQQFDKECSQVTENSRWLQIQIAKLSERKKKSKREGSPSSDQHQDFSGSSNLDEYSQVVPHETGTGSSIFQQLSEAGATFSDTEVVMLLHEAARRGDVECVRQLIEAGVDVNAQESDGKSAIHFAAAAGSAACIKWLHSSGSDVNMKDYQGRTPLHYAAKIGKAQSVKLLLAAGANACARDSKYDTPLHVATVWGNGVCVRLLACAVDDLQQRDSRDCTALHVAAKNGEDESLKQLLFAAAHRRSPLKSTLSICHDEGSSRDSAERLRQLLRAKANMAAWNIVGYTALHFAAANSCADCVRPLLEAGADIQEVDGSGDTPLHLAARAGSSACVRLLVAEGADVNETNRDGDTPLHLATGTAECMRRLLEAGASVTAQNNRGDTPLHKACARGDAESVLLLLESGAEVEQVNDDGDTPLHSACEPGCLRLLLGADARVSAQNNRGDTALHWAATKGRAESMKLLLDAGADVRQVNEAGVTPLHSAVTSGHGECARQLSEYGSKVRTPDRLSNTHVSHRSEHGCVRRSHYFVCDGASIGVEKIQRIIPLHSTEDSIRRLFENGVSVGVQETSTNTPLHYAATNGNADATVEADADLPIQNADSVTPMFSAVVSGSEACVRLLLRGPPDLQATDKFRNTVLHCAAKVGNVKTVRLLIREGAAVDTYNEKFETPLHIAVENGYSHCVEVLLEAKAPQVCNVWGLTPLHVAIKTKNLQIIRLLFKAGADVQVQDKNGFTPLHYVVLYEKFNCHYVVKLLKRAATNIDVRGPAGLTPLHLAAMTGCEYCVEQLLRCRASISKRDDKGLTALHHAAANGNVKCLQILLFQILLNGNADVHLKDGCGRTPLRRAQDSGYWACVKHLVEACRTLLERAGNTPLERAKIADCCESNSLF